MRLLIALLTTAVMLPVWSSTDALAAPTAPPCPKRDARCQSVDLGRGKAKIHTDPRGITGNAEVVQEQHSPTKASGDDRSGQRGTGKVQPVTNKSLSPQDEARVSRGLPPVESCGGLMGGPPVDCSVPDPAPGRAAGPHPSPDPRVIAQQVVTRLEIPAPRVHTGPDHNLNEWKMMVVGFPVWLWTTGPDTYMTTVTEQGLTMTLTARRSTTEFRLGDGATKFCGYTTPYHFGVQPGARSPSCDHIYQEPSKPGSYQVSATTHWQVTWSALDQTGTLPFQRTGPTTDLPVGELVSVRVGG